MVRREVRDTIRRPGRLANAVRPAHLRQLAFRVWPGEPELVDGRRHYRSYAHYVAHQRSKLALLDLSGYDVRFRAALAERLRALDVEWSGAAVLCLAARIGTEVRAFHDVGAFAVGIDLNPGAANDLVLPGDFHRLQFPDGVVDVVYCNSLDHALHLDRVVAEAKRVLRPGGTALIEAMLGEEEGTGSFSRWEARSWARVEEVAEEFVAGGFVLDRTVSFHAPWAGKQFRFVRPADA